jgi:para-aminobenzoate synthetase / 4-amino-4-deoxychorismate lyase
LETMLWTADAGYSLLARHLERLEKSARYFGFQVDMSAIGRELDRMAAELGAARHRMRLLVTRGGRICLKAEPLAAPESSLPRVVLAAGPIDSSNPFLYHKTTNRDVYQAARAARPGFDDVLLFNERGELTESTIANLAVELDGKLRTPPVTCGLLPGTLRAELLAQGVLVERQINRQEALGSPRVLLFNSVRGMYPVQVVEASGNNRAEALG